MSLDRAVFDHYLNELAANFYSGKPVSMKQADFLYNQIHRWHQTEFISVCKEILRTEQYFPKLVTWLAVRHKLDAAVVRRIADPEPCEWCDGYGWFYKYSIEPENRKYLVAYSARCPHSGGLSKRIPKAPSGEKFQWSALGFQSFQAKKMQLRSIEPENNVPF